MICNEVHNWYEFVICHQCISLFMMKYMSKYGPYYMGLDEKLIRDFQPENQADFEFIIKDLSRLSCIQHTQTSFSVHLFLARRILGSFFWIRFAVHAFSNFPLRDPPTAVLTLTRARWTKNLSILVLGEKHRMKITRLVYRPPIIGVIFDV